MVKRIILIGLFLANCLQIFTLTFSEFNKTKTELESFNHLMPQQGCSLIYKTDGFQMLAGNNEDYFNPLTKVWFIPGGEGFYGKVYFGFDDYRAQGGMNEKGLFFDALGLDEYIPISTTGKSEYFGNLADKIMSECASVDCAIQNFDTFYTSPFWNWQFFFGDANGDSAIIEPNSTIRQHGGYQAATNFLQSTTSVENYTDSRYLTAIDMLERMENLSVDNMCDVLDAVHVESGSKTLYSNIYDLNNRVVYLYYFHNFDQVVIINLDEELQKGYHTYDLPSLFSPNPEAERWAKPLLEQRQALIDAKLDSSISTSDMEVYAGEYEMLEGWGAPDETLSVILQEKSLLLQFPDYHAYELFPNSSTEFFCVLYLESGYKDAFTVRFGSDDSDKIQYLELLLGDEVYRGDRLDSSPFPTEKPTLTPTITHEASEAIQITLTPTSNQIISTSTLPATTTTSVLGEKDQNPASDWLVIIIFLIAGGTIMVWFIFKKLRAHE